MTVDRKILDAMDQLAAVVKESGNNQADCALGILVGWLSTHDHPEAIEISAHLYPNFLK